MVSFPRVPVETGRTVEETTGFTLDEAFGSFPRVPVETGRTVEETTGFTLDEVFGSFPPFLPLPVEETSGEETVELRTLEEETSEGLTTEVDEISLEAGGRAEDETLLASFPSSVTVK
jgi:hypothetical protein